MARSADLGGKTAVLAGGCVRFTALGDGVVAEPWEQFRVDDLTFARQAFWCWNQAAGPEAVTESGIRSAVAALARTPGMPSGFGEVLVECPDSEESKPLWPGCRALQGPLEGLAAGSGGRRGRSRSQLPRLHVLLLPSGGVALGLSGLRCGSPFAMGIRRLRAHADAPSRSALKLEEALLHFVSEHERPGRLKPGRRAVDLGAAPGGWTWVLNRFGLVVDAVDNGPLDPGVLAGGLVTHHRADGYTFRPQWPVDWMVCDMVAPPARVAHLVATWGRKGLCRESVFNLKLPVKHPYREVERCRKLIEGELHRAGVRHRLRFKQLYHDREEVTGHLRVETPPKPAAAPRAPRPRPTPGRGGRSSSRQGRSRKRGA